MGPSKLAVLGGGSLLYTLLGADDCQQNYKLRCRRFKECNPFKTRAFQWLGDIKTNDVRCIYIRAKWRRGSALGFSPKVGGSIPSFAILISYFFLLFLLKNVWD